MSTNIDQRVVEMRFDNAQFEKSASRTLTTLEKLKQKLNLTGASKGLEEVNSAAKKVDMSGLGKGIETVTAKFSALQVMGTTALANITNSAVNAAKTFVHSLTVAPKSDGFKEYEMTLNAIQTTMAGTGKTAKEVEVELKKLDEYADKTVYGTADMLNNLPKFTNAGVDLEKATTAMIGIANATALAGGDAGKASIAFYNLGQAIGTGYLTRMDYNSINNAGIATMEWKEQMIEAAIAQGTLTKVGEDAYKAGNKTLTLQQLFIDGLQEQWATTEVMMKVFGDYGDETTEIGKKAYSAAQDIKTYTMMMESLKATAGTGWKDTWQIIFGDLDAAKKFWTGLTNTISDIITKMADLRNGILDSALNGSKFNTKNWDKLSDKIKAAGFTTEQYTDKLKEVLKESGISVEDLVEKYGSLEKAIKAGAVPVEKITKALKKLLGVEDKVTMSTEELDAVAKRVIGGEFGNGAERIKKLAEAGYDYATVQNKVNELLGSSVRHTTNLTEAQLANADSLVKLTDEQLKAKGYTNKQIEALRELQKAAEGADTSITDLINGFEKTSGRTLLIDSFKNIWEYLQNIFKLIGEAWTNVFGEKTVEDRADSIYGLIEKFHDLTESMTMSEDQAKTFKTIMEGLFAGFQLGGSIASKSVIGSLKILNAVLGYFGSDIASLAAFVAQKITDLNNWVKNNTMFGWGTVQGKMGQVIGAIIEGVVKCYNAFMGLEKVQAIIERFKNLLTDLFGSVSDSVKFFSVKGIVETIQNLFSKLEAWIKGLDTAENMGKYIIEGLTNGITNGIKKAANALVNIASTLWTSFCEFWGIESPSKLMEGAGENIVQGLVGGLGTIDWSKISAMFWNLSAFFPKAGILNVIAALGNSIAVYGGSVVDKAVDLGGFIVNGLIKGITVAAKGIGNIMITIAETIYKVIAGFFDINSPSKLMIALGGFIISGLIIGLLREIPAVDNVLGKITGVISSWFKNFGNTCVKVLGKIDFGKIFAVAFSGGLIFVIKQLTEVLDKFSGIPEGLAKMFKGIGSMMTNFGQGVEAFLKSKAFENRGAALVKIAIAIAILAASVALLAKIDLNWKKALGAVIIIGLMAGILVALSYAINKLEGATIKFDKKKGLDISGLRQSLLSIGIVILLLAATVKLMGSMSPEEAKNGFLKLAGVAVGLIAFLGALNLVNKNADLANVHKVGKMMIKLAFAMMLMVGICKLVSKLSVKEAISGIAFATAFAIFVRSIGKVAKDSKENVSKIGGMAIKLAIAMGIMVGTVKLISLLKPDEMAKGVVFAAGFSLFVWALSGIAKKADNKDISKVGNLVLSVSIAMLAMAYVCKRVSTMSPSELVKGIAVVYLFGALCGALIYISKFSGANAAKAGLMLIEVSAAMLIMTGVLMLLKELDNEGLIKALGIITWLSAIFAGLIAVTHYVGAADKIKGTLITLAVTVGLLSLAIVAMSFLDTKKVVAASGALTAVIGTFALLLKASSYLKSGKKTWQRNLGTILVMTLVVAGLASLILWLSKIKPENALGAAGALGTLLLTLSTSLLIISNSKSISAAKLPNTLKALLALTLLVTALALPIALLQNVNPINAVGNAVALGILLNALAASLNIVAMSKSISAAKLPGILKSLAMLTVVAGALALVIYGLRDVDPVTAIGNATALSILLGVLSLVMFPLSLIGKQAANAAKGALALTAMVIPLAAFGIALTLIPDLSGAKTNVILLTGLMAAMTLLLIPLMLIGSLVGPALLGALALTAMVVPLAAFGIALALIPDLSGAQTNVMLLTTLMTAMTLLLIPLILIGSLVVPALLGVVALTAMVVPLAAFALALTLIPDLSGAQTNVTLLTTLMGAMTLLLIPLILIGALIVPALLGVVGLTAMIIPLAVFALALNKLPDLTKGSENINLLTNFMVIMTDLLVKVSLVAPLALIAVGAITALGGVITAFGVLATAVGALMEKFPALERFLGKGMEVLGNIAGGLGQVIGKFITGFANEVMTILPNLGTNLGAFMTNALPFFIGMSALPDNLGDKVKVLTGTILALSASAFIEGIASFFGIGLEDLGKELSRFAMSILPFITTIMMIDPGAVTAAESLANLILALSGASFLQGITDLVGKFLGLDGFSSIGDNLVAFAGTMARFSAALKKNGDIDTAAIDAAANAGLAMVKLAEAIPKSDGFLQDVVGEQDLALFGARCAAFGAAIKLMSQSLTGEGGAILINQAAIDAAITAGKGMTELAKALPKADGFLQDVVGEQDLATFGARCAAFGAAIRLMSESLSNKDGDVLINDAAIDAAVNAGARMSDLANAIPKADGLWQDIAGEKDLETFGTKVKAFGEAIKEMSGALTGEKGETLINDNAIVAAEKAGTMMAAVQAAIPADKWLDGKISIDKFGEKIVSFGGSLASYGEKVAEINIGTITSSITQAGRLADLAKRVVNLDTSGIDKFKGITGIADTMKNYAGSLGEINTTAVASSITSATRLKDFINGLVDLDPSGISNFKVGTIGTTLKSYATSVAEMDTGVVSSSISIASRLRTFIVSLAGIDTSGVNSFTSAVNNLGTVNVESFAKAFSDSASKLASAGVNMVDSLVKGVKSRLSTLTTLGTQMVTNLVKGINNEKSSLKSAITTSVSSTITSVRGYYHRFYSAGSYLVDGLASGISGNRSKAIQAAVGMATAAYAAAKAALDINSPSKAFAELGGYVSEGFAIGIDRLSGMASDSAVSMADSTIKTVSHTIAKISEAFNSDIDAQPTIRPVLDLSDVRSGAGTIGDMLSMGSSVGVLARVNGISSAMNRNGQNGNDDVVSALNALRKDIGNMNTTSYNINGITYDDGSAVSDAVQLLVRAAMVERRV